MNFGLAIRSKIEKILASLEVLSRQKILSGNGWRCFVKDIFQYGARL